MLVYFQSTMNSVSLRFTCMQCRCRYSPFIHNIVTELCSLIITVLTTALVVDRTGEKFSKTAMLNGPISKLLATERDLAGNFNF